MTHPSRLIPFVSLSLLAACGTPATDQEPDQPVVEGVALRAEKLDGADRKAFHSSVGLKLAPPTGPLPVGVRSTFLPDPARLDPATNQPRMLPIRIFYPARDGSRGRPARYLSPVIQPLAEAGFGLPAGAFDLDPHASEGVATRAQIRGVILVSPAYQLPVAFETAQVIDLASRGWTLVTFDHPHETAVAEQPGGTYIEGALDQESSFPERLLDVGLVLDHLSTLVPGWRPGIPVGMFGHSMGGSAAAESALIYPLLQAGVDLDGSPRGRVVDAGLDKPFGVMLSNLRVVDNVDDGMEAWLTRLRGPHPVERLYSVYHDGGFNDFLLFNTQASTFDPELGAQLEGKVPTHVDSLATADAALAAQRRYLAAFMRSYLDCQAATAD